MDGKVFGRLTVLRRIPERRGGKIVWECLCSCGNRSHHTGGDLRSGRVNSCGCWRKEYTGDTHRIHGMTHSKTHNAWQHAKDRCHNPKNPKYKIYGALGIQMAPEWRESFLAFLAYMGPAPEGLTLDRIDPFKGYEPGNCRWATWAIQDQNKRAAVIWKGERRSLTSVAKEMGLTRQAIRKRMDAGETIELAVESLTHKRERRPA
jgi:hypothetical protein